MSSMGLHRCYRDQGDEASLRSDGYREENDLLEEHVPCLKGDKIEVNEG